MWANVLSAPWVMSEGGGGRLQPPGTACFFTIPPSLQSPSLSSLFLSNLYRKNEALFSTLPERRNEGGRLCFVSVHKHNMSTSCTLGHDIMSHLILKLWLKVTGCDSWQTQTHLFLMTNVFLSFLWMDGMTDSFKFKGIADSLRNTFIPFLDENTSMKLLPAPSYLSIKLGNREKQSN